MNNKRQFFRNKIALSLCIATITTITTASSFAVADTATPLKPQLQSAQQKITKKTDFTPDPAKRLSLEGFIKGAKKLHGYLKNAVEKAKPEDKKFLVKEKVQMEYQIANPKATYASLFKSIDSQIKRLENGKIFAAPLVAQMRQHYLETEAGKVMMLLNKEAKRKDIDDRYRGEIEFQQGIIARRDQVNYKSTLSHFKNAVKLAPGNVDYLTALGDIYSRIEDNAQASKIKQQLMKMASK